MLITNLHLLSDAQQTNADITVLRREIRTHVGFRTGQKEAAKRAAEQASAHAKRAAECDDPEDFGNAVERAHEKLTNALDQLKDAEATDREIHRLENEIRSKLGQPLTDYETGEVILNWIPSEGKYTISID